MISRKGIIISIVSLLSVAAIASGAYVYNKNKVKVVEVKFIDSLNNNTVNTQEVEVGSNVNMPEEPSHEECKFTGWYTEDGVKVESFENITEGMVVYSKCEDYYFTVKFYDTLSKRVIETQKVKYGEDADLPVAPLHNGYYLKYWSGNYTNVKSNQVVSAVYAADKYKYTVQYYKVEDGKETLYTTKTYSEYYNKKVSAKIINIDGYEFSNDYSKNILNGKIKNNKLVLKVYYEKQYHTVSINYDNVEDTVVKHNNEYTLPELVRAYNVTFIENDLVANKLEPLVVDTELLGYCEDSEICEEMILPNTVVNINKNVTYYPVWATKDVNLNNGEGYSDDTDNYVFSSWQNEENNYTTEITLSDDITLTALYDLNVSPLMFSIMKSKPVVLEEDANELENIDDFDDNEEKLLNSEKEKEDLNESESLNDSINNELNELENTNIIQLVDNEELPILKDNKEENEENNQNNNEQSNEEDILIIPNDSSNNIQDNKENQNEEEK